MSLAGRLSDLSLLELLQIVSLSRKTGVLEICAEHGSVAWLGLREGGIVRVGLDDGSLDRDRILEKRALASARPAEPIDAVLEEAALGALLELLEWHAGDFTFEPCVDLARAWRGPQGVALRTPISPEYLALEGARLADESGSSCAGPAPVKAPAPARKPIPPATPRPVICVDRDLALLERIKGALAPERKGVHIFQDSASAMARLKQYLVRGEVPTLVVGTDLADPLDPRREFGWRRFAERVRALAPGVRIAVIVEGDAEEQGGVAFVRRPHARATDADVLAFLGAVRAALGAEA